MQTQYKNTNQGNQSSFIMEEGGVAEKTSYVENLNRLISHINHVAVYPSLGSYVEGVKQLDAMLESYKDKKYYEDMNQIEERIKSRISNLSEDDKYAWIEENASELSRKYFGVLMRLLSRSGLSPTGRIASIDVA